MFKEEKRVTDGHTFIANFNCFEVFAYHKATTDIPLETHVPPLENSCVIIFTLLDAIKPFASSPSNPQDVVENWKIRASLRDLLNVLNRHYISLQSRSIAKS